MSFNWPSRLGILFLWAFTVVLVPFAGIAGHGLDIQTYLEFPPRTLYVIHEGFSPAIFLLLVLALIILLAPFVIHALRHFHVRHISLHGHFPWWGYAGTALLVFSWIAAWSRIPELASLQHHTFTPLWAGYILVLNALCELQSGQSPMTRNRLLYSLLFIVSAFFWWSFEALNRFVQNWSYLNIEHFSAAEYFFFATLSFSTVLPAMVVTAEFLALYFPLKVNFRNFAAFRIMAGRKAAAIITALSIAVLYFIGIYPDELFPAVWIISLLLFHSIATLAGCHTLTSEAAEGRWEGFLLWALTGLWCGFFWEMWNYESLAKWIYQIPYVDRFRIFEMPAAGYAGYIPFGVLCGEVTLLFWLWYEGPSLPARR